MCTVTWRREEDGYQLLFNRDERKSRREADAPRIHQAGDVRWLAPVDGDFGGTWISANQAGLTLGLLNGYQRADAAAGDFRSRGLLVTDLASGAGAHDVRERLLTVDLSIYRTFRLLALDPSPDGWVAEWDGERLHLDRDADARRPLISSSFDETEVGARRRAEYARRVPTSEPSLDELTAYHRSTAGGPSAYSVSMERPEASTRSLTHVAVGRGGIAMTYHAGRPDLPASESRLRLDFEPLPSRVSRSPETP